MRAKNKLPKDIFKGGLYSVEFHISEAMIRRLIDLTGDTSSLHTNKTFARRSMYRENVVHGILPIIFISALKPCYNKEYMCSFCGISARFPKPTFVNDRLLLSSKISAIDEENNLIESEYVLKNNRNAGSLNNR